MVLGHGRSMHNDQIGFRVPWCQSGKIRLTNAPRRMEMDVKNKHKASDVYGISRDLPLNYVTRKSAIETQRDFRSRLRHFMSNPKFALLLSVSG
jgi:hypothetical protein